MFSSVWLFVRHSGSSVLHHLPELGQIHVHWISDAIYSSYHLLLPSPLVLNLSQQQGLFQWIGSLHQVAKVLELIIQYQSFQWVFSVDFLQDLIWFDLLAVQGTLVTYTHMYMCVCVCVCVYLLCLATHSCPTLCDSINCSFPDSSVPGYFPGKNTGVSCYALFQGNFPTQGLKPSLLYCRQILYNLSHQGKPKNTKVGSLSLLQGILPTQKLNWDLQHCRWVIYQLSYQGSPYIYHICYIWWFSD